VFVIETAPYRKSSANPACGAGKKAWLGQRICPAPAVHPLQREFEWAV